MLPRMLSVAVLREGYRAGRFTPRDVIGEVLGRMDRSDPAVWITKTSAASAHAQAAALGAAPDPRRQLWGVPFAVKDNIDYADLPTTAACAEFAYQPETDATVVARLRAAGAIVMGKTNLDQFATGLNGTRSPFGAPRCVFDARYISGGSSSGSAVAVASGQVAFALGTDTAGSGRVPAAFNNLVGIKPTRGVLSTHGVVPACRSLDCVTVMALSTGDASDVMAAAGGYDESDPYSRHPSPRALPQRNLRFGVLSSAEREFDGDSAAAVLYEQAIARLEGLGGQAVTFDYAPFREAAALLYEGPWPAERLAAIEPFFRRHAAAMDPVVRQIIERATTLSAADAFRGLHELQRLRRVCDRQWADVDVLLLPTAPTIYTVADMQAEPIRRNSSLGRYTNFVNLLDGCAVAVPAGFRPDGLPFGVTLVAPAFADADLARLAARLHQAADGGLGADRAADIPDPSE
jgi:allophanate hydrolase